MSNCSQFPSNPSLFLVGKGGQYRLTNPQETALHFKISTQTLWRWRKSSAFPQPIRHGRTMLYDIKKIERWMLEEE